MLPFSMAFLTWRGLGGCVGCVVRVCRFRQWGAGVRCRHQVPPPAPIAGGPHATSPLPALCSVRRADHAGTRAARVGTGPHPSQCAPRQHLFAPMGDRLRPTRTSQRRATHLELLLLFLLLRPDGLAYHLLGRELQVEDLVQQLVRHCGKRFLMRKRKHRPFFFACARSAASLTPAWLGVPGGTQMSPMGGGEGRGWPRMRAGVAHPYRVGTGHEREE
jgi:hypothetical protein